MWHGTDPAAPRRAAAAPAQLAAQRLLGVKEAATTLDAIAEGPAPRQFFSVQRGGLTVFPRKDSHDDDAN